MNIIKYDTNQNLKEINEFVEALPLSLKTKVNMQIYKETYSKIQFLQTKSDNFITWVCPLLKPVLVSQDQYIFYEGDVIDSIYYLCIGAAGFVLPFRQNIVYVEIMEGDDFGQADIVSCSIDCNLEIKTCSRISRSSGGSSQCKPC